MIDIVMLGVLGVVTWCVASEGALGAGMTLLCVVFGGLLAMNFFEPLAGFLTNTISASPSMQYRWDFIALMGLFILFTFLLRLLAEYLSPAFIQTQSMVYEIGRWACALATGYATVAILLTAFHTAPLPRVVDSTSITEFMGFKAEGGNFFGMSPDRQWLGFTQFVTRKSLSRGRPFDGATYVRGDFMKKNAGGEPMIDQFGQPAGEVWPSFPIRYASRREQLFAGSGAVTPQGTEGLQPVKRNSSSSGPPKRGRDAESAF